MCWRPKDIVRSRAFGFGSKTGGCAVCDNIGAKFVGERQPPGSPEESAPESKHNRQEEP